MLRKINLLIIGLLVVLVSGCSEDFLETTPTDAIAEADAFASVDNMFLVLNGLHRVMYAQNPLPGGTSARSGQSFYIPALDAMAGTNIHSAPGNGWMTSELRWLTHTNANFTTVNNFWYMRYHIIATSNNLINLVEANGFTTADADVRNILGQAYAYRAWAYHQLVSTFGKGYLIGDPASDAGVPLLLEAGAPYTSEPRSTVQVIYDQINADIENSISFFDGASSPDNKSHLSINAAYGIKARIDLTQGKWQDAADAAVLARSGFPLLDESDWLSGFNTTELSEVIWGGTVIDAETNYFQSYFYFISPTFNGSQNRTNPKLIDKEVYDAIPSTDFRINMALPLAPNTNSSASNGQGGSYTVDPNYDNEDDFWDAWEEIITKYGMTTGHNTHPYMAVKFLQKNPGSIDPDDVIYMRASEMYLIEAEAKAMLSDVTGAQTVLQEFGGSRDSSYDASIYASQDALMEHIKWQRAVELYGEGFSFHDYIRWDQGIDLTNSGADDNLYRDGFIQEKPSLNDAWIWKIPQAEINANPNLTEADQN
ncbi:RagB/SusD family nutrient uptake outer membrane protein [Polaribacter sp. Asnod1-A03]|uniref:RagB/SusD family nutrient uptake outer membrane protein n=1 Tax=Polaribacter sp. Asnod1-A03 TaxID=3160581 RepID=UPI00386F2940